MWRFGWMRSIWARISGGAGMISDPISVSLFVQGIGRYGQLLTWNTRNEGSCPFQICVQEKEIPLRDHYFRKWSEHFSSLRKNEEICESIRENSRAVLPSPYRSQRDCGGPSIKMWRLRGEYRRIFQMKLFGRNISGEIHEKSSTENFGRENTHTHTRTYA